MLKAMEWDGREMDIILHTTKIREREKWILLKEVVI